MRFKAGDSVVHIAHGVGQVIRLDEKRFSGQEARLYYEVETLKGTVWVPVDTPQPTSLRRLTTASELARYRGLLTGRPEPLDPDRRKRHLQLLERMKQGSFQVLCESVRDVSALGWKKPLGEGDIAWLRKAREDLCHEWASAAGVSLEEAAHEIDRLLEEGRQQHAG
jgi:RNA polymerase-interacting CarD/CdnL/TRCF family regulator